MKIVLDGSANEQRLDYLNVPAGSFVAEEMALVFYNVTSFLDGVEKENSLQSIHYYFEKFPKAAKKSIRCAPRWQRFSRMYTGMTMARSLVNSINESWMIRISH